MEQVTPNAEADYVARAKALMKRTACAGALVIVPLAMATHARASIILPTGPISCCDSSAAISNTGDTDGLNGFVATNPLLSGSASYSGGGQFGGSGYFESWGGPLEIDSSGSNCAGVGSECTLPELGFNYDFSISTSVPDSGSTGIPFPSASYITFTSWTITLQADGITLFTQSGAAGGYGVHAFGSAYFDPSTDLQAKATSLAATGIGDDVNFTLSFVANWVSHTPYEGFNPISSPILIQNNEAELTAAPEPGTLGLFFTGVAGIAAGWFRRRRRA